MDSAVITDAIDEFDKRVETLDQAQTEVEMAIDEVELEEDIAAAWDFREKCREPRVEAGRLLVKVSRDRLSEHGSVSTTEGGREASLPKLELPSFCRTPANCWATLPYFYAPDFSEIYYPEYYLIYILAVAIILQRGCT